VESIDFANGTTPAAPQAGRHTSLMAMVELPQLRTTGFEPPYEGAGQLLFFEGGWELWSEEPADGRSPVFAGNPDEIIGADCDDQALTITFTGGRVMAAAAPPGEAGRLAATINDVRRRYDVLLNPVTSLPVLATPGWGEPGFMGEPAPATSKPRKGRWLIAAVAAVTVLGGSTAAYLATRGPSKSARYLDALTAVGVRSQFTTDRQALANATRVCADLDAGKPAVGYARDRVGVQNYCSDYLDGYKVIPTPEEQQTAYLDLLRSKGLAGKFSSDANALANARRVCDSLKNGGKQQGLAEDQIGVQVYCEEFLSGFHVLEHRTVTGSFTLIDSDPSYYFPAISSAGGTCWGSGGYSDISSGTEVYVKNAAGNVLAHTALGTGTGSGYLCRFTFSVDLTEGEDSYLFEVSHRGTLTYTFAELASDPPALSLGS
jgi:hypothetical protein